MTPCPAPPTLLEDWRERRRLLADMPAPRRGQVEVELRILDYLIQRYAQQPEAARPAKFPVPHEVVVNERAMLVHHHVGQYTTSGVKSAREAEERIVSLLHRMHGDETDQPDELAVEADAATAAQPSGPPDEGEEDLESRARAFRLYQRVLEQHDLMALSALSRCHPRSAADYALRAWRHCISEGHAGRVLVELEALLREPPLRDRVLDPLRLYLGDPDPRVRIAALKLIGDMGELDDIGLLMDLLSLPPSEDETPEERALIHSTIEKLSSGERFAVVEPPLARQMRQARYTAWWQWAAVGYVFVSFVLILFAVYSLSLPNGHLHAVVILLCWFGISVIAAALSIAFAETRRLRRKRGGTK